MSIPDARRLLDLSRLMGLYEDSYPPDVFTGGDEDDGDTGNGEPEPEPEPPTRAAPRRRNNRRTHPPEPEVVEEVVVVEEPVEIVEEPDAGPDS